jgi:tripartite-type tricarboxylate transporter receptor subunit TctC
METPREGNVKLPRRRFLQFASGSAAALAAPRVARTQTYPARLVHLIVPFAAGGSTDIIARLIGQWLSERLGQPFVIENRPGAGSNIGTEAVVRASADGYTLLMVTTPNAINATLYEKLPFDFTRDVTPVASVMRTPNVMEVNPSLPVKTVPEFIDYARANPAKVAMASAGTGGVTHVAGELFKAMAGINIVHVPYRGDAPALIDLISGQVQVMFDLMPASIEYIRAGKLRALAVTTTARSPLLPYVPTVSEFVPGYEASTWVGVGAPKQTPSEIVEKLNKAINAALTDPKFKPRLEDLGATALAGSPADFGKLIEDDTKKWAKVIRAANIKPD